MQTDLTKALTPWHYSQYRCLLHRVPLVLWTKQVTRSNATQISGQSNILKQRLQPYRLANFVFRCDQQVTLHINSKRALHHPLNVHTLVTKGKFNIRSTSSCSKPPTLQIRKRGSLLVTPVLLHSLNSHTSGKETRFFASYTSVPSLNIHNAATETKFFCQYRWCFFNQHPHFS
jgi:hypothetical protein